MEREAEFSNRKDSFRIKSEVLNNLDYFPLSQLPCVTQLSSLCLNFPICSTGMCHSGTHAYLLHEEIQPQMTVKSFVEHSVAAGERLPWTSKMTELESRGDQSL